MNRTLVAWAMTSVLILPASAGAYGHAHGQGAASEAKTAAAPARKAEPVTGKVYLGESKQVGHGTVRSWVAVDDKGAPARVGVTFDESVLLGLPMQLPKDDIGWEWNLALPKEVSAAPFDHVAFYWNPRGHIPDGVYNIPHFDIHFFMVPEPKRAEITAMNYDLERCFKLPKPEFLPAGYILPPQTEHRRMGVHWVDPTSHEFHGHDFTATLLWGSYDGEVNFIEPMMTRTWLETRPDVSVLVKQPASVARTGHYPTSYSVRFDPEKKQYTVAMDGLIPRQANVTASR